MDVALRNKSRGNNEYFPNLLPTRQWFQIEIGNEIDRNAFSVIFPISRFDFKPFSRLLKQILPSGKCLFI